MTAAELASSSRSRDRGAASAKSEDRLRQLVDEHFDLVWRALRRFGVPAADLDDGVQQVFWVASRRLADIDDGKERAFLFQTALRVASDSRRTHQRRRETGEDGLAELSHATPSPEDLVDLHRAREVLDQLLEQLPLELRAVLVLFEMEQMSRTEIAEALDLPPGTVASRLNRARALFDEQLAASRLCAPNRGEEP
jgi:RNA polymerase sigma-70 factor (ECF subfamily)